MPSPFILRRDDRFHMITYPLKGMLNSLGKISLGNLLEKIHLDIRGMMIEKGPEMDKNKEGTQCI